MKLVDMGVYDEPIYGRVVAMLEPCGTYAIVPRSPDCATDRAIAIAYPRTTDIKAYIGDGTYTLRLTPTGLGYDPEDDSEYPMPE